MCVCVCVCVKINKFTKRFFFYIFLVRNLFKNLLVDLSILKY